MELQVIDKRNILDHEVTTYGDLENPLFLAKDVASWIEHSDVSKMMKSVDEDEKVKNIVRTLGGNQEMWFLTEDGLYEVLMQSRKPIAKQFKKKVKKLLKDLRLNRFNPYENMSKELQAILLVDKKQQELDNRITTIEDKMTVNYELAENLRSAINCRAVELLGGKDAEAYKKLNKKLYASFYRDIKRTFKVNSYKNLSVKNYDLAISFIEAWEPKDEVLKYAIHGLNSQIAFA
ncbi:MAG: ORF6C domain-containing protein [Peptostreptococcaceae bacterium]|nr:ORF6C domain-containing protein [Peptostreptococcaceae bacterium]